MGIASGLSLAFVPFEFKGAKGLEAYVSSRREVGRRIDKGQRGKNPPGVLLRGAREV